VSADNITVIPGDNIMVIPGGNITVIPGDNITVIPGGNIYGHGKPCPYERNAPKQSGYRIKCGMTGIK
jgi:hypothetical protein